MTNSHLTLLFGFTLVAACHPTTSTAPVAASPSASTATSQIFTRPPLRIAGDLQPFIPPEIIESLRGRRGESLVLIRVGKDGVVDDAIVKRTNLPELNKIVTRHIIDHWRYEIPTLHGQPTRVEFVQPFTFNFTAADHASPPSERPD